MMRIDVGILPPLSIILSRKSSSPPRFLHLPPRHRFERADKTLEEYVFCMQLSIRLFAHLGELTNPSLAEVFSESWRAALLPLLHISY